MLGALIGAGASLLGGLMGRSDAKDQNRASRQMQKAEIARQDMWAQKNIDLQKQFAQEGLRWKVEDAKAAGIHPLYALGAQSTSFSPVSVGAAPGYSPAVDPLPNAMAAMGQDLGRAVDSTRTAPERVAARAMTALQLEGMKLDNDIKRATFASSVQRINQNANPPVPSIGPFAIPEGAVDPRSPLMLSGSRVLTDPGTSPGQAWEDQLGDDIMSPGFLPNLWGMVKANYGNMSFTDILRSVDRSTRIW
ncbi:VP2 [Kummerowia striata microvirus]|nr:VP2 [Kummerowia striata microvirus]